MSTCTKKRYANTAQAERALERVRDWRRRHTTTGQATVEKRSYFCLQCRGFHLTAQEFLA